MRDAEAIEIVKNLKVGQKVKVIENLVDGLSGVSERMKQYQGIETHIIAIGNYSLRSVQLDCDKGEFAWSPDMFEVLPDIKYFNVGDRVRVKSDLKSYSTGMLDEDKVLLAGRLATVTSSYHEGDNGRGSYSLDVDGICRNYSWSGEWIEEIKTKKDTTEGESMIKNVTFNGKGIKRVLFNGNATIVFFSDGTKVVTRRKEDDTDDKEKAIAMALVKSVYGKNFYKDIFETFIPKTTETKEIAKRPIRVGDKMRVKSWETLIAENGEADIDGDIFIIEDEEYFMREGKNICGKEFTVKGIDENDGEIYTDNKDLDIYWITSAIVEHIN